MWFTEGGTSKIGRITTSGDFTEFALTSVGNYPFAIVAGPDGNLWFTESNTNKIGRITTSGAITEFLIPTANFSPGHIATGPDGNLWITEYLPNKIGRITPAGVITEFTVPTANSEPYGIALGPDGNLWFTEFATGKIGRIFVGAFVTATPANLSFQYQPGGTTPPPRQIAVNANLTGLTYSVTVATTSGENWLFADKTGGIAPDALSVSVSPTNLTAGKTYQGTVTINGTGSAAGTTVVPVSLTITPPPPVKPLPTIASVRNAASFSAGAISPGEIVSIFGTAIGPPSALGATFDGAGKVASSIGGVQVLFNGTPAPLLFASDTQINCVVPYEVMGISTPVQVKYLEQGSNVVNLPLAASAPAIFSTGSSPGSGQGAILNFDNIPNSLSVPAAAGSIVQVYMTGEGRLSPAGVTGSITCSAGCDSIGQIPVPLLNATALVNNRPAVIGFIGEAPGFVSGVLQVNLIIPLDTPSGNIPISISVGGIASQPEVTVAVK